jgi:hypothetical protein
MDWKGMFDEAVDIFGRDISKSLARFGSTLLPIPLLPLLLLGYFGLNHLYVTTALGGLLSVATICLRLQIAKRLNPGHSVILTVETAMWTIALYGTGWIAGQLLYTVAGWQG